jgi:hypothetical protein
LTGQAKRRGELVAAHRASHEHPADIAGEAQRLAATGTGAHRALGHCILHVPTILQDKYRKRADRLQTGREMREKLWNPLLLMIL